MFETFSIWHIVANDVYYREYVGKDIHFDRIIFLPCILGAATFSLTFYLLRYSKEIQLD
jgi:hypothetical protein